MNNRWTRAGTIQASLVGAFALLVVFAELAQGALVAALVVFAVATAAFVAGVIVGQGGTGSE